MNSSKRDITTASPAYKIYLLRTTSHDAPVPHPIMQHFVTQMYTCVHISVTKRCIVGNLMNCGICVLDLLVHTTVYSANPRICSHTVLFCVSARSHYMNQSWLSGAHFNEILNKTHSFYPRPVLAFVYCRCLRVCVFPCVHQSRVCPRDNSSTV